MFNTNFFNEDAQELFAHRLQLREEREAIEVKNNERALTNARNLREYRRDMEEERISKDPFFYID